MTCKRDLLNSTFSYIQFKSYATAITNVDHYTHEPLFSFKYQLVVLTENEEDLDSGEGRFLVDFHKKIHDSEVM